MSYSFSLTEWKEDDLNRVQDAGLHRFFGNIIQGFKIQMRSTCKQILTI